jgi:ABC-2 type transport system ATP-binding protein
LGTKDELKQLVGNRDLIKVRIAADKTTGDRSRSEAVSRLQKLRGVSKVTPEDGAIDVLAENGREILAEVCGSVSALGIRIHSVEVQEPDLESVFLHLTGKALRE